MMVPSGPASLPTTLAAWLPDFATISEDLAYAPPPESDMMFLNKTVAERVWRGMRLSWLEPGTAEGGRFFFSGSYWSRFTSEHWEIPLVAVAVYLVMIPTLKAIVAARGKFDVKDFAFWWNTALSVFSVCGVFACVPVLASTLLENGLYFTVCADPAWYGSGWCGFFVALFIYSKVAELVDTVLLLLAKKPVIALQWWHHSTVLLYCWHSYSVRIATGAWFACMNYSVHSVMYGYFALTATSYRKVVAPYAIYITLAQLLQMLVGMYVTIKAVLFQIDGQECHVNKTNSVLGLTMYFSYFVLFGKLFIDNYYLKPKGRDTAEAQQLPSKKPSATELVKSVSRQMTAAVGDHEEDSDEPSAEELEVKKTN